MSPILTVMDLRAVVIISTLLLVTVGSDQTTVQPSSGQNMSTPIISTSHAVTSAPTAAPTSKSSSCAGVLGLLTVKWTSKCEGRVHLLPYPPFNCSPSAVCHSRETNIPDVLTNVCQNKKGCKDDPSWPRSDKDKMEGFNITERGANKIPSCTTLRVKCKVEVLTDLQGQLQAYKVVTALLCCVLLVLLLIRFTRPTMKALQKRLSDRRQSRWIGPTQSHSVSYHRGKTVAKNDGEKRLSYPALERLAISDSREPSSNRNSDYNF